MLNFSKTKNMSKSKKSAHPEHDGKGFLALAGEALSVLGEDIKEGKDKVVEVAAEKITIFKKAVKRITHKKKAAVKKVAKKAPAKKVVKKAAAAPKKAVKKAVKKAAKKIAKKAAPAKKKK
jgi:hypothetical protein